MKYQEYKELSDAMEQAAHKFYQLRYQQRRKSEYACARA